MSNSIRNYVTSHNLILVTSLLITISSSYNSYQYIINAQQNIGAVFSIIFIILILTSPILNLASFLLITKDNRWGAFLSLTNSVPWQLGAGTNWIHHILWGLYVLGFIVSILELKRHYDMGSWVPELEQMNHISPREEPHSSPIEETATEIKRNLRIKKYLRYFAYALVLMSLTQGLSNIISPNVDLFEFDLFTSINIPSVLFNLAFVALLEESLLRWLPFRILRRYSEHENFIHFMLFLYFLIGAATHMTNISSAPPFEAMKYFGIHGWGGFVLGYVYIREKFRASFSTHFMYNSLLYFRYLSYFFVKEIISIV